MNKEKFVFAKEIVGVVMTFLSLAPIGVLIASAFLRDEIKGFWYAVLGAVIIALVISVFHYICKTFEEYRFIPDTTKLVEQSLPVYFGFIISFLCFALAKKAEIKVYDSALVVLLIVVFLLGVVQKYLKEFANFLVVNSSNSAGVAQRKIFNTSYKLGIVFVLVLLSLYAVVALNPDAMSQLEAFVGMLLAGLKPDFSDVVAESTEQVTAGAQSMESMDLSSLDGLVEPNIFLSILIRIVLYALASLSVVLLAVMLYWGVKELIYKLKNKDGAIIKARVNNLDEVFEESKKLDKKEESPGRLVSGLSVYFSRENRIRRKYRKYILSNKNKLSDIKLSSATPRECDKVLDMGDLLQEYEDVRYKLNND